MSKIVVLRDSSTGQPPNGGPDDELAVLGMKLWPVTFGKTEDLVEARRLYVRAMQGNREFIRLGMWSAMQSVQWAHYGYPSLSAGHKFAAALMATSAHLDSLDDVHVPWFAFRCIVPDGLLALSDHQIDRIMISRVIVDRSFAPSSNSSDEIVAWSMSLYHHDGNMMMEVFSETLYGLLVEPPDQHVVANVSDVGTTGVDSVGPTDKQPADRLAILAQRYVLGLLITLQQHPSFGGKTERPSGPRQEPGRTGPPRHRTFVLGHPIAIDCRSAVKQYLVGDRHAPPSVQTLVRGHWKRQVVGVGRGGRKIIHVEPYWRGPEGAPILVHEYTMGQP